MPRMLAPSFPRRVGRRPSRFLFGWLLFALALRALVPVGYMPDAAALRDGRWALEFCAAAGGLPMSWRGHAASATAHAGQHQAARDSDHHHGRHGHDAAHGHDADYRDDGAHHDDGAHGAAGQECPFGLTAHQALDLPPVAALVVEPPRAPRELAWRRFNAGPPLPAAGPPLGQRAPPRLYG